jgi:hypothetical protein
MGKGIVKEHIMRRTFTEDYTVPSHVDRSESPEFKQAKKRLMEEGHDECFICGSKEDLQIHHFLAEWSMENSVDFSKLRRLTLLFDIYGYGKKLKNTPVTTIDDIRNCMVLCRTHHTGTYTGVHNLTFTVWLLQLLGKDGIEIVNDVDGE